MGGGANDEEKGVSEVRFSVADTTTVEEDDASMVLLLIAPSVVVVVAVLACDTRSKARGEVPTESLSCSSAEAVGSPKLKTTRADVLRGATAPALTLTLVSLALFTPRTALLRPGAGDVNGESVCGEEAPVRLVRMELRVPLSPERMRRMRAEPLRLICRGEGDEQRMSVVDPSNPWVFPGLLES